MRYLVKHGIILVLVALLSGWGGYWLSTELVFKVTGSAGLDGFWSRFQVLFIVAVLIERSVETYLNVTGQNGQVVFDQANETYVKVSSASKEAQTAALVLSVLVAMCGLRILESVVDLKGSATLLQEAVWNGVDIIVSAGLMAGGSELFHKLASVITTGLDRIRDNVGSAQGEALRTRAAHPLAAFGAQATTGADGQAGAANLAALSAPIRNYTITIERPKDPQAEQGILRFVDGGMQIVTQCWWDKNNRIDPSSYARCSKTHMARLGIPAIYLPDAVSKVTGEKAIFLHHGSSPQNSLGCLAVSKADFDVLWAHITPQNAQNVTVVIKDV